MSDDKYNGWTNRNTWAFKLHIDNNEGDYNYWMEETKQALKTDNQKVVLADRLKEWFEEVFDMVINQEQGQPTKEAKLLIQDVGNGHDINWFEIAEALIADDA